jgi:hypothetical protein
MNKTGSLGDSSPGLAKAQLKLNDRYEMVTGTIEVAKSKLIRPKKFQTKKYIILPEMGMKGVLTTIQEESNQFLSSHVSSEA